MDDFKFKFATENDLSTILSFIKDLAIYENMLDQVVSDENLLKEWIFEKKKAEVIFVLEGEKEVGFALFFHNFSCLLFNLLFASRPCADSERYFLNPRPPMFISMSGLMIIVRIISNVIISVVSYNLN